MKTFPGLFFLLTIYFTALASFSVQAQNLQSITGTAAGPSASPLAQPEPFEVQKRFSAILKKVNEQPDIQELRNRMMDAQEAYQAAVEVAITKEDPNILTVVQAVEQSAMASSLAASGGATPRVRPGFAQLSPADRDLLLETRKIAMNLPSVKAAREKRDAAKTVDERKAANSDYRTALRQAMLEVDAKVGPILEKMEVASLAAPLVSPSNSRSKAP